jgi:predicted phage terminase large subunit-like protein
MPHLRYLGTSHKQDLAVRDNMKCRRLIQSQWYQKLWPIVLTGDQNAKTKFENDKTGFREAMAFNSMTGSRGDRVLLDDPLSVDSGNSDADLLSAELTFTEALPTRVNNDKSAIVVIMQRLNERDTSGLILSRKLDYVHLCLPMEFEPERRCTTRIGFTDPRTFDGELIFPERFPQEQVAGLKKAMGGYAVAGQFQQRPVLREGGLFKRHWFKFVGEVPKRGRVCRAWDLASTVKKANNKPDWTVGLRMWRVGTDYYIDHVARFQETPGVVSANVASYAKTDPRHVKIRLPQDPGQAGKAQAETFIKLLAGYTPIILPVSGDKETRARPAAIQAEAGNVYLVEGDWNETFLDEVCSFPMGAHDDQVDAFSDALNELALGGGYDLAAAL